MRWSGRTVKWIGDGVELYFRRPADAVRCSLDLSTAVPRAGLPQTHVGINAGPLVYENGDFYGRTVNIAARVAGHATAGQVIVTEAVVSHAGDPALQFRNVGPAQFKGVSEEIVLYEAIA